ncbi:MAG: hypothetical protein ACRC62_16970 [Microcoleus sp.]
MRFFRKSIARILVVICCCLLAVSCGESREVQCTKLTEAVTKGNALIDAQHTNYDIASTKKLAKDLDRTAKQIENLKLTDSNLKEFQQQLVTSFREMGEALGDIGKALEVGNRVAPSTEGREQIKKAQANIARAGKQANRAAESQDAVNEKLVNYCKNQIKS